MLSTRTTLLFLAAVAAQAALLRPRAPAPFNPKSRDESGWPGWRGAHRTGVSSETKLLAKWPKAGPRLLWKTTSVGGGFSTPAVSRSRIYLLGALRGKEHVLALDAAQEGKELWTAELGNSARDGPPSYPGPRSTPTVDGEHIFALGSAGDLLCLSTAGKVVWRKNLPRDFGGAPGQWGYAESPLIDGDAVICTPGGPTATLVALNRKTGAVVWKAAVPRGNQAAYASAITVRVGGVRHYVQFLSGCLVGVSAADGKLLWIYEGIRGQTHCTTPVFHDDHVFVTTYGPGVGRGGALLKLTAEKGGVTVREVYRNADLANHYGGVVYLDGCLYGTNSTSLVCIDFATGKTRWRNTSVGKGAVTAADSHLYVRGDRGPIALVAASPAGYTQKGRFDPLPQSRPIARPHPVIAYGRLYIRDQETLLCYDLKNE